ncbi:hypothetical protein Ciccas_006807 [Cichlidogyrus casuarinus]|uniref:Uncharacterized protein n=1 Tax=Cichlidogyrus casuarinus TaxID=1844966 RepID=A0ABD2Q574_9PLAT
MWTLSEDPFHTLGVDENDKSEAPASNNKEAPSWKLARIVELSGVGWELLQEVHCPSIKEPIYPGSFAFILREAGKGNGQASFYRSLELVNMWEALTLTYARLCPS